MHVGSFLGMLFRRNACKRARVAGWGREVKLWCNLNRTGRDLQHDSRLSQGNVFCTSLWIILWLFPGMGHNLGKVTPIGWRQFPEKNSAMSCQQPICLTWVLHLGPLVLNNSAHCPTTSTLLDKYDGMGEYQQIEGVCRITLMATHTFKFSKEKSWGKDSEKD